MSLEARIVTAVPLAVACAAAVWFLPPAVFAAGMGAFVMLAAWEWTALARISAIPVRCLFVALLLAVGGVLLGMADSILVTRAAMAAVIFWIGALLLAVHPRAVEYSGDVQSDGLYLALFLGAVACLWRALSRGSLPAAAATGGLAGLAYLTRPEGLGLVLVAYGLGALQLVARTWSFSRLTRFGVALGLGLAFTSSPYLLALRAQVSDVREWPVDLPTFARLAGFVAIGLASWVGAALVDVAIETVLR